MTNIVANDNLLHIGCKLNGCIILFYLVYKKFKICDKN